MHHDLVSNWRLTGGNHSRILVGNWEKQEGMENGCLDYASNRNLQCLISLCSDANSYPWFFA